MRHRGFLYTLFLTACMVTLYAGTVGAEMRKGAISLNPQIGGHVFEGNQSIGDDLTYGLGIGYSFDENWAVEGNFNYTDTGSEQPSGEDVKAYVYRLDALYHFLPFGNLVPYVAAGIGAITVDGGVEDLGTDPLLNYGAGVKYFITDNLALRGDVRHLVIDGSTGHDIDNNLLYTFGVTYLFGGEKKMAAAAAPATQLTVPEAKPAPAPQPKDTDGDGVTDDLDKCPGTPRGVAVDKDGCPLDSDGDGVPDYLDKCPDTPKGVAVDENGCPPVVKETKVIMLDDIHFDFDKATLTDEAKALLKKNLQTMKDNPEVKVRIEGHACAHGPEDYNLRLSDRRANAVKEYLVNGGINADRMSTITYGETRLAMPEVPTPQNKNSNEAKANRRVHFEVLVQ